MRSGSGQCESEIAEVTQSTDPEQERTNLASRVAELESRHREAMAAQTEAGRELAATQQAHEDRERAAREADQEAVARIEQRDQHVTQACFDNVGDVRNAVRDDTAQARLRESVAHHERDLHATELRVRDLQSALGGERVSEDQLEEGPCERATDQRGG